MTRLMVVSDVLLVIALLGNIAVGWGDNWSAVALALVALLCVARIHALLADKRAMERTSVSAVKCLWRETRP